MSLRGRLLIAVDLAIALLFVAMAVTGYLQRFSEGDYGDIHFWISCAFVPLILVHIMLHWSWIKATFGKRRARA